jgi:hypothetical protein
MERVVKKMRKKFHYLTDTKYFTEKRMGRTEAGQWSPEVTPE